MMVIGEAELKVNWGSRVALGSDGIGRPTKHLKNKAVVMLKDKIQLQGSER
jgi:hypothetical protein